MGCVSLSVVLLFRYASNREISWTASDTSKSRTSEIAADDGDGFADSARALGFVEAVFAFGEGCVEERKTWGWGLGDGGVLGTGEEGERGQGQYFFGDTSLI
jgi:hypothetical protein